MAWKEWLVWHPELGGSPGAYATQQEAYAHVADRGGVVYRAVRPPVQPGSVLVPCPACNGQGGGQTEFGPLPCATCGGSGVFRTMPRDICSVCGEPTHGEASPTHRECEADIGGQG